MVSSEKIEIEKFNGQSFELWKLKMEDLLVDKDQWIVVYPGEAMAKALWDKLGTLYQSKSLVNKLFLRKKLYNLRMKDGDSVTEHLNEFNTVNGDALSVRGRSQNRNKNKSSSGISKSRGRSKSLGKPIKVVRWKCGKEGHFRRDCKSKAPDKGKGFDDAPSVEAKTTLDEGGDVYLASSSTHVDHEAWLIDSGASFHFTPHREWFCEYEKYDGGDVFIGDDRKVRIIGHGKIKLKL
eukprot:PITA_29912